MSSGGPNLIVQFILLGVGMTIGHVLIRKLFGGSSHQSHQQQNTTQYQQSQYQQNPYQQNPYQQNNSVYQNYPNQNNDNNNYIPQNNSGNHLDNLSSTIANTRFSDRKI